jgi:hypothetical protein
VQGRPPLEAELGIYRVPTCNDVVMRLHIVLDRELARPSEGSVMLC